MHNPVHTPRLAAFLPTVALLLTAPPARADLMLIPAGLNPGDQFRVAFVSSEKRDATSPDVADYDGFITDLAAAAGIDTYFGTPITWQAIGSTPTVDAIDRLPAEIGSPPIYNMAGGLVAFDTAYLWNVGVVLAINVTESGADLGGVLVSTATAFDGPGLAPLGSPNVFFGYTFSLGGWVSFDHASPFVENYVYGVSSVLTVPSATAVPEPASLALMLAGLATVTGGAAAARRRRHALGPAV